MGLLSIAPGTVLWDCFLLPQVLLWDCSLLPQALCYGIAFYCPRHCAMGLLSIAPGTAMGLLSIAPGTVLWGCFLLPQALCYGIAFYCPRHCYGIALYCPRHCAMGLLSIAPGTVLWDCFLLPQALLWDLWDVTIVTMKLQYDATCFISRYVSFPPAIAVSDDSPLQVSKGTCVTNGNRILLSCAGRYTVTLCTWMDTLFSAGHHDHFQRLCSCRNFIRGQVAIPPPL